MKEAVDEVIKDIFLSLKDKIIKNNNECNAPCIFFYEKDNIIHKHSINVNNDFIDILERFGHFCYDFKIEKIAVILDITYKKIPTTKETVIKDIQKFMTNLDETEDPSLYPPSLRSDAFIAYFLEFKKEDAVDIITYPYTIQEQKIIQLEKETISPLYIPETNKYLKHIIKGFIYECIYEFLEPKIKLRLKQFSFDNFLRHLEKVKQEYPGIRSIIGQIEQDVSSL